MGLLKFSHQINSQEEGKRLDQVLAEVLPVFLKQPVSKSKIRKLIISGAIYLNRKRVRIASKPLYKNAKVEAYIDLKKLFSSETEKDFVFQMSEDFILFEDAHLIIVNKPPGLPTQPTLDEARNNLFHEVGKFLARREGVSNPYLGLHHRLDRDTSGIILLTKTKEINPGIAEIFSKHQAKKIYSMITQRPKKLPEKTWTVKNYLSTQNNEKKQKFISVRSGGNFAHTDFVLKEILAQALWIEAHLHTGRTHQIRVHLSEMGLPVLGDSLYGTPHPPRMMLHAHRLTFQHPMTSLEISVECPLPKDFTKCLQNLRTRKTGS